MSIISKREVTIPSSIEECYRTDSTSNGLWYWCEQVEKWGNIFFFTIIVVGIVISIITSQTTNLVYYGEFNFWLFFASMVTWIIYAVLEKVLYKIVVLILSSYATIVQNTTISANVALYNVSQNEKEKGTITENVKVQNNSKSNIFSKSNNYSSEWICKKCGTKNSSYTFSCKDCGVDR